jgi:hypothetical protein
MFVPLSSGGCDAVIGSYATLSIYIERGKLSRVDGPLRHPGKYRFASLYKAPFVVARVQQDVAIDVSDLKFMRTNAVQVR